MSVLVLLVVASVAVGSHGYCTNQLECFKSKLFNFNGPPEDYYNISIFADGGGQNLYNAVSFGDFNNDFRTDIIAVDANGLNVYLWNNQSSSDTTNVDSFERSFSDSCASNSTGILLSTLVGEFRRFQPRRQAGLHNLLPDGDIWAVYHLHSVIRIGIEFHATYKCLHCGSSTALPRRSQDV
jgi:hypothetical protein